MKGIEKQIDELGRIVIPRKLRSKFNLTKGSKVFLFYDENSITIVPEEHSCTLCGKTENLSSELPLCQDCIARVKKLI